MATYQAVSFFNLGRSARTAHVVSGCVRNDMQDVLAIGLVVRQKDNKPLPEGRVTLKIGNETVLKDGDLSLYEHSFKADELKSFQLISNWEEHCIGIIPAFWSIGAIASIEIDFPEEIKNEREDPYDTWISPSIVVTPSLLIHEYEILPYKEKEGDLPHYIGRSYTTRGQHRYLNTQVTAPTEQGCIELLKNY